MINKLFKGILIAILVFWGIYGYRFYTWDPSAMRNRIEANILYTIIFFVSIILLYILSGKNKIFKFLSFIVILINLFLIGDSFFRNNIGLNSQQFIMLFGLIVLAIAISYIKHRIRFILIIAVGGGIGFVLLTGILPMYEHIPNINEFIQSQKSKIINKGASEGVIIIKNALGTKELKVNELTTDDINLSEKTQISFASKTLSEAEKIFIDLGNGTFINLNPQSAITLEQSWENIIMQILQGNIEYTISENQSWALEIIGKYNGTQVESTGVTIRSQLTNEFEQKKEEYFIQQLGGNMILNPAIDKIIRFFINTLYNISPKTYQNNLTNYNNIQNYLGNNITEETQNFTGESMRDIINDLISQAKRGTEDTKLFNQLFK